MNEQPPEGAEANQCDGCARGLPIRGGGIHYGESPWDLIACTAHRYKAVWRPCMNCNFSFNTVTGESRFVHSYGCPNDFARFRPQGALASKPPVPAVTEGAPQQEPTLREALREARGLVAFAAARANVNQEFRVYRQLSGGIGKIDAALSTPHPEPTKQEQPAGEALTDEQFSVLLGRYDVMSGSGPAEVRAFAEAAIRAVRPQAASSPAEPNLTHSPDRGTRTVGPDGGLLASMPSPSAFDLVDPLFNAIWNATKTWDVNAPEYYIGYCGLNGSHVMLILNAIRALAPSPTAPPVEAPVPQREALPSRRVSLSHIASAPYSNAYDAGWNACLDAIAVAQTATPQGEPVATCEVCSSAEDVRRAPAMTGIPFDAPPSEQRYVCGACIRVWHSEGKTTSEEILAWRGLAAPPSSDGRDPKEQK